MKKKLTIIQKWSNCEIKYFLNYRKFQKSRRTPLIKQNAINQFQLSNIFNLIRLMELINKSNWKIIKKLQCMKIYKKSYLNNIKYIINTYKVKLMFALLLL